MMPALPATAPRLSIEEFLASEEQSEMKHEYLGGDVYAMAGASEAHNVIATNLIALLHRQLRGGPCQAFGSDMKVRLYPLGDTYFYYPDAMVACDPADAGHGWRERPAALFEIMSEETRRVDEREKRVVYLQLPSLQYYLRIEQDRAHVWLDRRGGTSWEGEKIAGLEAVADLPALGLKLPLSEIYERLLFGEASAR